MPGPMEDIFSLPDLGEGLHEAEIVAWHVAEGDHVVVDQPLVSVETDKAVVEVPSPRAGRIARLLAGVHAHLPVGAPLVAFAADEADTGTVVGTLAEAAAPAAAPPHDRPLASPAVRTLAAGLHVDLAGLAGTGPEGEITRADVQRAAAGEPGAEALRGMRRAMAARMAAAGASVVPATVTEEADVDAWPANAPVTARLVAALVAGCRAEPALNAAFDAAALTRRSNAAVHVGIAVDTEDGLIVPVLRDAGRLGPAETDAALHALVAAAQARRLDPQALRGATISLSNFGPLGGLFAALVVVPPQVAILGAGRIVARAVPTAAGIAARKMLPLSLTFDHRAVTGGEAARFLAAVKAALEAREDRP
jgi:2-oxoisovalerate dehydrogenase E2 component (dihydrolipoyl transacylase)